MNRPAARVIEELRSAHDSSRVREAAAAAADCLSKARITGFTSGEHADVDQVGVTESEAREIELELVNVYHRMRDRDSVSTIIWALSKARNPALRSLFIDHAEIAMRRLASAYAELSQCVIGLEDFAPPPVIEHPRSKIMAEAIDHADGYLREAGRLVPIA